MTTIGGLFEGYGGLTAAVREVLGGELAWYSEIDPAASRVLAHHHSDVPNLGNITTIDWEAVPPVDILCGGFPCQDVSAGGKRAGLRPGTRSGLWSYMAYAISQLQPALVVIENVPGLLSARAHSDLESCAWCVGDRAADGLRALGAVLGDLADLGFDAEWVCVPAAGVGCPHLRRRVFILAWPAAHPDSAGRFQSGIPGTELPDPDRTPAGRDGAQAVPDPASVGRAEGRPEPAGLVRGPDAALCGVSSAANTEGYGHGHARSTSVGGLPAAAVPGDQREAAADTAGPGWGQPGSVAPGQAQGPERETVRATGRGRGALAADTSRGGRRPDECGIQAREPDADRSGIDWREFGPAIRRWERILGRSAPAPTVVGQRGARKLSPVFVEWLMGLPGGHVTDVPGLSPNDCLRLLGNGVVTQQAAAALRLLLARLETSEAAA